MPNAHGGELSCCVLLPEGLIMRAHIVQACRTFAAALAGDPADMFGPSLFRVVGRPIALFLT